MSGLWSYIAIQLVGACYVEDISLFTVFICSLVKGGYWLLLLLPPLIGLVFGFDTMLHYLSKFWGTHKETFTYVHLKTPIIKEKQKIFKSKDLNFLLSPLIKITEHSFTIMNKSHKWNEISKIRILHELPPFAFYMNDSDLASYMEIEFNSGKKIKINGDCIEKKYNDVASTYLSAFEEMAHEFKKRHNNALKLDSAKIAEPLS